MKVYCEDMIIEKFYKNTKNNQIEILFNALGLMSMCNSQSEIDVIANSMGYVFDFDKRGYIKTK